MNLLERIAHDPVCYAKRIVILLFVAMFLLFAVSGCATTGEIPKCPTFDAGLVPDGEGGYFAVFRLEELKIYTFGAIAEAKGECQ